MVDGRRWIARRVTEGGHPSPQLEEPPVSYHALHERRWRIAIALTAVVAAVYFGFILLVAYAKPTMGRTLIPGLSVGILLGALVIIAAWATTWIYVRWANTHFDAELTRLKTESGK